VKRLKNILFHFLLISLSFAFVGVRSVEAEGGILWKTLKGDVLVWQEREVEGLEQSCNLYGGCTEIGLPIKIKVSNLRYEDGTYLSKGAEVIIRVNNKAVNNPFEETYYSGRIYEYDGKSLKSGDKVTVEVEIKDGSDDQKRHKLTTSKSANLQESCEESACNTDLTTDTPYDVCQQIDPGTEQYTRCMECFVDKEGVWTAVGCIPQDPASAIESLVKIGLGIAGGVVLIMIIVGAFMLSASQGDPNKVGEAKEIITSAIIGLIFIIFSVTLLQFIGVEILHIPGFGE
jgi:hypothetical protein